MKKTLILAIDTSCDDTSAAVTQSQTILSNVIASQTQLHKQYGGVFPTVAKQAHRENIEPVIQEALKRARISWKQIAAIAVTQGPGLAPALEVGITKAKELAESERKPLVAVNHIEGHVLSPLAERKSRAGQRTRRPTRIKLPVLSLVISGGHSEFVLVPEIGQYQRLGGTVDDAAGEVLDKVGRMLNLGYPAGPVIEKFAIFGNPQAYRFPIPMTTSGDFNLSFSGLKTSARNLIEQLERDKPLTKQQVYDLCASFQFAVFRAITYKLDKVLATHSEVKEVWLGGGVAANLELRRLIRETTRPYGLSLRVPYTKRLCMDNAAMIGLVGGFKLQRGETVPSLQEWERQPRLQLG